MFGGSLMNMKKLFVVLLTLVVTLSVFASYSDHTQANSNPYLRILAPTGGEMWQNGSNQIVAWASSNLNPQGKIFVYYGDDTNWFKIAGPIPTTLNAHMWKVEDVKMTYAKVKVTCFVGSEILIEDVSEGYVTFTGSTQQMSPPVLVKPLEGEVNVSTVPTFHWEENPLAYSYRLQISRDQSFNNVYMDRWIIGKTSYTPDVSLGGNVVYYWRMACFSAAGTPSLWTYPRLFETGLGDNANYFMSYGTIKDDYGNPVQNVFVDFKCETSGIMAPESVATDEFGRWTQTGFKVGYTFKAMPRKIGYDFVPSEKSFELWKHSEIDFEAKPLYRGGLIVAYPNGGEVIKAGSEQTIRWTSSGLPADGSIYISLIRGSDVHELIAGPVSVHATSYIWQVPERPTEKAKIFIECRVGDIVSSVDDSNWWFMIQSDPAVPTMPTLLSPYDGSEWESLTPTLSWKGITGYNNHLVQLATDPQFANIVVDRYTTNTWLTVEAALRKGMTYYWRVKSFNNTTSDTTEWSWWWHFKTGYQTVEEGWQASGYVTDEYGNPVYGALISFVCMSGSSRTPSPAVTNSQGFWVANGFVPEEKYAVYPALLNSVFSPPNRTIDETTSSGVDFKITSYPGASRISVRSPSGGSYVRGTTQLIAWAATDIPHDAVYYVQLLHDGKVMQIKGPLGSDVSSIVWEVPDVITNNGKVRVQAWKNAQVIAEGFSQTISITGP